MIGLRHGANGRSNSAEKKATHDFILSCVVLSVVVAPRDYRAYLITPREKHIMCISRTSSDMRFVRRAKRKVQLKSEIVEPSSNRRRLWA